jgi:hypothetical protein
MAETLSLMEFLQALHADAELRSSFAQDPQGTLAGHGLSDLSPADVHDALVLVQDNQTVDFTLDAAPPPPPPAGDGHEAAVEYLARYLDDPQPAASADPWADLDPDAAVITPAAPEAPLDAFGAGEDLGYGAGAGGLHPAGADGYDHGGYDLDGYGDPDASAFPLDDGLDVIAPESTDPEGSDPDSSGSDGEAPGEDPGPELSAGA